MNEYSGKIINILLNIPNTAYSGVIFEFKMLYLQNKFLEMKIKNFILNEINSLNKLKENLSTGKTNIEKIKQESRRYAKRQLTWFRKNKETIWLNSQNDMEENIISVDNFNLE